jgi:hypothetical protein
MGSEGECQIPSGSRRVLSVCVDIRHDDTNVWPPDLSRLHRMTRALIDERCPILRDVQPELLVEALRTTRSVHKNFHHKLFGARNLLVHVVVICAARSPGVSPPRSRAPRQSARGPSSGIPTTLAIGRVW